MNYLSLSETAESVSSCKWLHIIQPEPVLSPHPIALAGWMMWIGKDSSPSFYLP